MSFLEENNFKDYSVNNQDTKEQNTYEKIEIFFEVHKALKFSNFQEFLDYTELTSILTFTDLENFWRQFSSTDDLNSEFDMNTAIELVETQLESEEDIQMNYNNQNESKTNMKLNFDFIQIQHSKDIYKEKDNIVPQPISITNIK